MIIGESFPFFMSHQIPVSTLKHMKLKLCTNSELLTLNIQKTNKVEKHDSLLYYDGCATYVTSQMVVLHCLTIYRFPEF